MQIAAAYVRVSTDDQTEYSPDSQIKIIRDYAKAHDMIVPDEFIFADEGVSGRKAEKRPAFMAMISAAKQKPKPFDVILVYSLSRFARNREDSVVFKRMLRKDLGIELISTSQEFGNDKSSILIEALLEAMDEYYSIDLGENVRRGMREKASRGEPLTIAPFGYAMVDKRLEPDPDQAPIVQKIFADFIAGKGYREIATGLNQMGLTTNRGNRFENRTIEYIIRNPAYAGKIRWNPTHRTRRDYDDPDLMIVTGHHEPLVGAETWEEAQAQAAEIKRLYGRHERVRPQAEFTLRGMVRCSNCGRTLTKSRESYLQCHGYAKGACGISHSISIDKLTRAVVAQIVSDFATLDFTIAPDGRPAEAASGNAIIEQQIKKEQQKLLRVKEAYEAGIDTIAEYQANKARITKKIDGLTAQITDDPGTPDPAAFALKHREDLNVILNPAKTEKEKNSAIRQFVQKIVFDRPNSQFQIYYRG